MNQARDDNTQLISNRSRPPNQSCYGSLGYEQRVTFFTVCLSIGVLAQCAAIWILYQNVSNTERFGILFASGFGFQFFGTTFIVSIKKQLLTAGNKQRFPALILYLLTSGLAFSTGYYVQRLNLTFGFLVLEICSYIWYCFCWSKYSKNFLEFMATPEEEHHHNLELAIKGRE